MTSMRGNCIRDMVRFHSFHSYAVGEIIDHGYRRACGHNGERFKIPVWREAGDKDGLTRQPLEQGMTLQDGDV